MILGPVQFYRSHAALGKVSVNNLVGKYVPFRRFSCPPSRAARVADGGVTV